MAERRQRRTFTDEFKAEAVHLFHSSGRSLGEVAEDLDIGHTVLREWVRKAASDGQVAKPPSLKPDEVMELKQLRKENRLLRQERDLLKKAAAFFAREDEAR